jgi:hypothetical protein
MRLHSGASHVVCRALAVEVLAFSMSGCTDSTLPSRPVPSVVIVAPAPDMLDSWLEILQRLRDVPNVRLTDLAGVATTVAQWRPLAVLVERELFEFDREAFNLLARDVGAELIVAEGSARKEQIAAALLRQLETALGRWRARHD